MRISDTFNGKATQANEKVVKSVEAYLRKVKYKVTGKSVTELTKNELK